MEILHLLQALTKVSHMMIEQDNEVLRYKPVKAIALRWNWEVKLLFCIGLYEQRPQFIVKPINTKL
jgi:hypothetical protein